MVYAKGITQVFLLAHSCFCFQNHFVYLSTFQVKGVEPRIGLFHKNVNCRTEKGLGIIRPNFDFHRAATRGSETCPRPHGKFRPRAWGSQILKLPPSERGHPSVRRLCPGRKAGPQQGQGERWEQPPRRFSSASHPPWGWGPHFCLPLLPTHLKLPAHPSRGTLVRYTT